MLCGSAFIQFSCANSLLGNLDTKVNEEILWELFLQCGPVVNVHIPRDKITGDHQVSNIKFTIS